jgi:hypothetical protein
VFSLRYGLKGSRIILTKRWIRYRLETLLFVDEVIKSAFSKKESDRKFYMSFESYLTLFRIILQFLENISTKKTVSSSHW